MIQIFQIEFGTPEYDEAVRLRYEVLRKPLGLEFTPEQLAGEYAEYHLVACSDNGSIVAYLNLTPVDANKVKMRQVAVSPALQRQGVGAALVKASETLASRLGFNQIVLHARESAVQFYLRNDYSIVGDRFDEVTIPHFKMVKNLEICPGT